MTPENDISRADDGDGLVGSDIAGCRIMRRIGQGAMGTVYLAEQKSVQRQVAVKLLRPEFANDDAYIDRFEREARSSARLVSFNVVPVYDFGRQDGRYYLVTGYVDGVTVQDMIDERNCIDVEASNDIVLQAVRGLAAAEEVGVVHRDLKPENLMIDRDGVVKITDFGLAKEVNRDASITQAGTIVGTPYYISPEQAQGMALDHRSDIYSLGVSYFHMVTGNVPFDAENVIGILLKHISAERPRASEVNPAVPEIVSRLILKMMAREPGDRFQSADALIKAMTEVQKRLGRGDVGAATRTDDVGAADAARRKRYKRLKSTFVAKLVKRSVNDDQLAQIMERVSGDSGVFVESAEIFPENSVVEMRFTVPGRSAPFDAVGLVRWVVSSGPRKGMGITFLNIKEASDASSVVRAPQPEEDAAMASPVEVIRTLTRSPLHSRMLKYFYANTGRTVAIQQITGSLGVGTRMIKDTLDDFRAFGLAVDREDDQVSFLWPDDEEVQEVIVDWITKYGLR